MQEVFVRLWTHRHQIDPARNIKAWLLTTAYRLCIDRLRRDRGVWQRIRGALLAERSTTPSRTPEDALQLDGALERAQAALDGLDPRARAAMIMKHCDGMAQWSIAETLSVSEGYISKLISRATAQLRADGWEAAS